MNLAKLNWLWLCDKSESNRFEVHNPYKIQIQRIRIFAGCITSLITGTGFSTVGQMRFLSVHWSCHQTTASMHWQEHKALTRSWQGKSPLTLNGRNMAALILALWHQYPHNNNVLSYHRRPRVSWHKCIINCCKLLRETPLEKASNRWMTLKVIRNDTIQ